MLELFAAPDGGFYLTGADAPALVVRPRDNYDGVIPAAGSVATSALVRLGALTGNEAYVRRAEAAVAAAAAVLDAGPIALPHLIGAALTLEHGALEIVIAGDRRDLVDAVRPRYLPESVLAWGEPGQGPLWEGRDDDRAYVCRGGVCLAPVERPADLIERDRPGASRDPSVSTPARRRGRVRLPRTIRPGTRRAQQPGERLRCLVLADVLEEWIGVDLASGAFVRSRPGIGRETGGAVRGTVVELEIAENTDPDDPVRPELVCSAVAPNIVGLAKRRPYRRLLRRLAAPEHRGTPLLGSWGGSIAYVYLSGNDPSVVLLQVPYRSLELFRFGDGRTELGFDWGGAAHRVVVADEFLCRVADGARGRSDASARHELGARLPTRLRPRRPRAGRRRPCEKGRLRGSLG